MTAGSVISAMTRNVPPHSGTSDNWDVTLFADNVTDERANLGDNRSIAAETPGARAS